MLEIGWFKYVPHSEVREYELLGWENLGVLKETHHGHYAELMRWTGTGEPPCRKDSSTRDKTIPTAQAG